MSMSTYVAGIIEDDDEYLKKKAVYDACHEAGIAIPEEIGEFFGWKRPDEKGTVIDLDEYSSDYNGDAESGLEIRISDIPDDVKIIRFINSY